MERFSNFDNRELNEKYQCLCFIIPLFLEILFPSHK